LRAGGDEIAAYNTFGVTYLRRGCCIAWCGVLLFLIGLAGRHDIFLHGFVTHPLYIAGFRKCSFGLLAGIKIAGVIATQRPFQGAAPEVAVSNDFFEDGQVGAGIEKLFCSDTVTGKISLVDLHQTN